MALGGLQQLLDIIHRQCLGQALFLAGSGDLDRRVVHPPAFLEAEAIKLLDRGEPARPGRAGQPLRLAMHQIVFDVGARGGLEAPVLGGEPVGDIAQVAAISQKRIVRGPKLGGLGFEKGGYMGVVHRCQPSAVSSSD